MSSILVTEGAGFIGSHLTDTLLKQRHEAIVIDNFNPYYGPEIKRTFTILWDTHKDENRLAAST